MAWRIERLSKLRTHAYLGLLGREVNKILLFLPTLPATSIKTKTLRSSCVRRPCGLLFSWTPHKWAWAERPLFRLKDAIEIRVGASRDYPISDTRLTGAF